MHACSLYRCWFTFFFFLFKEKEEKSSVAFFFFSFFFFYFFSCWCNFFPEEFLCITFFWGGGGGGLLMLLVNEFFDPIYLPFWLIFRCLVLQIRIYVECLNCRGFMIITTVVICVSAFLYTLTSGWLCWKLTNFMTHNIELRIALNNVIGESLGFYGRYNYTLSNSWARMRETTQALGLVKLV